MPELTLLGTPTSHFTRKVRILLHELDIGFKFKLVPNLLDPKLTPEGCGGNPLMQVPTLIDGDRWLIDSDHIARYIVKTRAPADDLCVLSMEPSHLNRLAVLNGIMTHEVALLAASLGSTANMTRPAWLRRREAAMIRGLSWLDEQVDPASEDFDYVDIATIAMWHHYLRFRLIPAAPRFPRIAERVARFASRKSVVETMPAASAC